MGDWAGLRTAAAILAWVTVIAGLTLGVAWIALGGGRSFGPNDELMAQSRPSTGHRADRFTAWTSAQIGMHGIVGVFLASLLAYAIAQPADDRLQGYLAVLAVASVSVLTGLLMF